MSVSCSRAGCGGSLFFGLAGIGTFAFHTFYASSSQTTAKLVGQCCTYINATVTNEACKEIVCSTITATAASNQTARIVTAVFFGVCSLGYLAASSLCNCRDIVKDATYDE